MRTVSWAARENASKGMVRRLRRDGRIPCVFYSNGQPATCGSIPKAEIEAALRSIAPGSLPATVFVLKDQTGGERKAIVREIQYTPTAYEVLHVDFLELIDGRKVSLKIPVECAHTAECAGVKLGGQLRYVMRHVKVSCLPQDIPASFIVDTKDIGIRQSRRIRDLSIPATVQCLARPEDVVVSVNK